MRQAQQAYLSRDYDTAVQLFGEVLELDPQNIHAIQYLRMIRATLASQPPAPKDPTSGLMLPKVELKDATFSSALDFLKQEAAKQGVTVSFVSELPPAQAQEKVTLSLSNIPFLDALRYLCQLDNATYDLQRYAIVISPTPIGASSAPAAAQ